MTKGCIFSQNNEQHETGRISVSNIGVHWVWAEFLTKCQPILYFCIISISELSFIFYGQKWAWIYKLVLFWPKLRLAEHKMCRLMCQNGPLFSQKPTQYTMSYSLSVPSWWGRYFLMFLSICNPGIRWGHRYIFIIHISGRSRLHLPII